MTPGFILWIVAVTLYAASAVESLSIANYLVGAVALFLALLAGMIK